VASYSHLTEQIVQALSTDRGDPARRKGVRVPRPDWRAHHLGAGTSPHLVKGAGELWHLDPE
jgi:hypothetical protein